MRKPTQNWLSLILSEFSPPEDHAPGALIYSWGVEMLRLGFELAAEIFLSDELAKEADNDGNDDCRDDINRQG